MNQIKTITDLKRMKERKEKISMITAYDYPTARYAQEANIDTILVGDSLGMVVLGYEDTTKVTMDDMIHHVKAVTRAAKEPFVVADLPFMSYGYDIKTSVENAGRLIKEGGANAVKLEGGTEMANTIRAITNVGIPVVGHIGYTPQSTNAFGKEMVRGKSKEVAKALIESAKAIEAAGAVMIVLELVPADLADFITKKLSIPTIGIGAGISCDGQVLVLHDMLGMFDKFSPKHNKKYANIGSAMKEALINYRNDVKELVFPTLDNSFSMPSEVMERLIEDEV